MWMIYCLFSPNLYVIKKICTFYLKDKVQISSSKPTLSALKCSIFLIRTNIYSPLRAGGSAR